MDLDKVIEGLNEELKRLESNKAKRYKSMVITFDNRINNLKALSLVSEADAEFQTWGASTYMTDKYTVTKVKYGYRITKRYNVEPICKWKAPNTCKICAQNED